MEGRFPGKMVRSSSDAKAPRTKATTSQQGKQTGVKREKTRAQKDAHNASCQRSRERKNNQDNKMREEYWRMKKELEDLLSVLPCIKNEMQKRKRAVEEQRAMEAQMRQFPTSLKCKGQSFSTSEQMSEFLLSRTYEPHHQGLDNPNITASEPRPSFDANNIGFYVPNNNISSCDPAAGVLDFGPGSSFDANVDDVLFDWTEMLESDAVAGISETTNLVVENQNNELVNQIDHNALSDHSSCDPAAGPYNTNITACVPCPSFVANYKCFDVSNNYLSSCDHVAGVLVSGAGSSFHANDGDLNSVWMGKMSKPDTADGISQTKNLVVEIHNNELVNQIDHNAMVQRRELSHAQRSAENERDQQHMPEYKIKPELKRLRNVVVKYEEIAPLFNTISQLAEESKQMNDAETYLARRIQEVDNIVRQHIQEMHNKSFDHGSENSHTVMYTA